MNLNWISFFWLLILSFVYLCRSLAQCFHSSIRKNFFWVVVSFSSPFLKLECNMQFVAVYVVLQCYYNREKRFNGLFTWNTNDWKWSESFSFSLATITLVYVYIYNYICVNNKWQWYMYWDWLSEPSSRPLFQNLQGSICNYPEPKVESYCRILGFFYI